VYDWLLALHILSAAALVAAVVLYSVLILGTRGLDRPSEVVRYFRLARVGDVLMPIGALGVLIFGIWLAIDVEAYQVWDGWVIAAIVLWFIFGGVGSRLGKLYNGARDRARKLVAEGRDEPDAELRKVMTSQTGLILHLTTVLVVILFFVVMIYKPGA
jgi:uncharacterized membrane protein